MTNHFIIEADGGSRGNPGSSGCGAVIIDAQTGEVIREISEYIGVATNNVAEYKALRAGVQEVLRLDAGARVSVRMDSKLVIEQMRGVWKIKHPDMRSLADEILQLTESLDIEYEWIPRELNSRADALANLAMDMKSSLEPGLIASTEKSPVIRSMVAEYNQTSPSSVRAPGHVTAAATTLILVRHGRTHFTETQRISGRGGDDPGLSDLGKEDAKAAADAIWAFGKQGIFGHMQQPTAVVSSPILRTRETAAAIASRLGVASTTEADFEEISFGDWDGLTHDEAKARSPKDFESWRGSWTVSPPNGESLEAFDARIQTGLDRLLAEHEGESVVVVAHVMPIRGLIRKALSGTASTYWSIQVAPCSITVIRFWGHEASEVVAVNSTGHLA